MKTVAVSACLMGEKCRYDAKTKANKEIIELLKDCKVIKICPEIMGGLPTPRPPSERLNDKYINIEGKDVTKEYLSGSNKCLKLIKDNKVDYVVLKSKSPACGKGQIYDGSFTKTLINGNGSLCELLIENNIKVYSELEIDRIKEEENA